MDNEALILDLIEFVNQKPRSYAEVMEAWRSSCPRLTIWEDAVDYGFVIHRGPDVYPTAAGRRFLQQNRGEAHASRGSRG